MFYRVAAALDFVALVYFVGHRSLLTVSARDGIVCSDRVGLIEFPEHHWDDGKP